MTSIQIRIKLIRSWLCCPPLTSKIWPAMSTISLLVDIQGSKERSVNHPHSFSYHLFIAQSNDQPSPSSAHKNISSPQFPQHPFTSVSPCNNSHISSDRAVDSGYGSISSGWKASEDIYLASVTRPQCSPSEDKYALWKSEDANTGVDRSSQDTTYPASIFSQWKQSQDTTPCWSEVMDHPFPSHSPFDKHNQCSATSRMIIPNKEPSLKQTSRCCMGMSSTKVGAVPLLMITSVLIQIMGGESDCGPTTVKCKFFLHLVIILLIHILTVNQYHTSKWFGGWTWIIFPIRKVPVQVQPPYASRPVINSHSNYLAHHQTVLLIKSPVSNWVQNIYEVTCSSCILKKIT